MNLKEKTILYITLAIAAVGVILGISQDIANIPGVGKISNYALVTTNFAIIAKQVLEILKKHIEK